MSRSGSSRILHTTNCLGVHNTIWSHNKISFKQPSNQTISISPACRARKPVTWFAFRKSCLTRKTLEIPSRAVEELISNLAASWVSMPYLFISTTHACGGGQSSASLFSQFFRASLLLSLLAVAEIKIFSFSRLPYLPFLKLYSDCPSNVLRRVPCWTQTKVECRTAVLLLCVSARRLTWDRSMRRPQTAYIRPK